MNAFVCDACGKVIKEPYEARMREFYLGRYNDDDGYPITKRITKKRKVDLCSECFHGLYLLAEKEVKQ